MSLSWTTKIDLWVVAKAFTRVQSAVLGCFGVSAKISPETSHVDKQYHAFAVKTNIEYAVLFVLGKVILSMNLH